MRSPYRFNVTDESATVQVGSRSYTVKADSDEYAPLVRAIGECRWDDVPNLLTKGHRLFAWLRNFPDFQYQDNAIYYKGRPLPADLYKRIIDMEKSGSDPKFLVRFWQNLSLNPSNRSLVQTYKFLMHHDISIDDEGYILAYKGINNDWYDRYTGKTHLNTIGSVVREDRNLISDDPSVACGPGLHAGSESYAVSYGSGGRMVIVRIHPRDVVCVPKDHSNMKMRCCEYSVVAEYTGTLGTTTDRENDEKFKQATDSDALFDFSYVSDLDLNKLKVFQLRRYASRYLKIRRPSQYRKDALVTKIVEARAGTKGE